MADYKYIAGRIRTTAADGVSVESQEIIDLTQDNKTQAQINSDVQTELSNRYTKEETYSKTELNSMITTPEVEYVTVESVSDFEDMTGAANAIYRVPGYDGNTEQADSSVYSEYAWDGSQFLLLSVKSGNPGDGVFDISVYNASGDDPATYDDLSDALGENGANVPSAFRAGGMSIKFIQQYYDVTKSTTDTEPSSGTPLEADPGIASGTYLAAQLSAFSALPSSSTAVVYYMEDDGSYIVWTIAQSSDNKYVQYRLMSDTFNTTVANWQGVDDEPTVESKNLIESGAVYDWPIKLDKFIGVVDNYDIRGYVSELYIDKQYLTYQDNPLENVCFKAFEIDSTAHLYIRNIVSGNDYLWNCEFDNAALLENYKLYELKTDSTHISGGVPTNTIVGYIIFRNIGSINQFSDSNHFNVIVENAINLTLSPQIAAHIAGIIHDGDIGTSKLADAAVTHSKMGDNSVGTNNLQNNSVTLNKFGNEEKKKQELLYSILKESESYQSSFDLDTTIIETGDTIYGRGGTICSNKKIYGIKFQIGNGSLTSITQIKVVFKKDNNSGETLAEKIVPFVYTDALVLHDVVVQLDSPIEYTGEIYCTIQCNNKTYERCVPVADYPFNGPGIYTESSDFNTPYWWTAYTKRGYYTEYEIIEEIVEINNDNIEDRAVTFNKLNESLIDTELSSSASKLPTSNAVKNYVDNVIEDKIDINLPDVIYSVKFDILQLYYESILKVPNPYDYDIKVSCDVGKQFPRYYELQWWNVAVKGDHTLEIVVKNKDGQICGQKQATIKCVDANSSPTSQVNILCVGASTTVEGQWVGEMKKRLTTSSATPVEQGAAALMGYELSNVNFVGRLTRNDANFEATGGFNYNSYLTANLFKVRFYFTFAEGSEPSISLGDVYSDGTYQYTVTEINIPSQAGGYNGNISCSCSGTPSVGSVGLQLTKVSGSGDSSLTASLAATEGNPFVYNGVVDVAAYAAEHCNNKIDYVVAYLFSNGIITPYQTDFTAALSSMQSFIDLFINAGFTTCKFGIMLSQNKDARGGLGVDYCADADNIWTYHYGMKVANHNLLTALQEYINDNNLQDKVFIVNILNEFDYWNDYLQTEKQINPRSPIKEVFGVNGVHPSDVGYYQIADSAMRTFIGHFCPQS